MLPSRLFRLDQRQISPERCIDYIEIAQDAMREAMILADPRKTKWKLMCEKKDVMIFQPAMSHCSKTELTSAQKDWVHVSATSEFRGSLDDVVAVCAADNDASFSQFMKRLNPNVLQTAALGTIVRRVPAAPFQYIGLRWFVQKIQSRKIGDRDYCCLEIQDKLIDYEGNECFIRILRSMTIPECPAQNLYGFVRARVLLVFIYRKEKNESDLIWMHHILCVNYSESFPQKLAMIIAESELWYSVQQMKRMIIQRQSCPVHLLDRSLWIPNYERRECVICYRNFNLFRSRHHCRCCGEVICAKCSTFQTLQMPSLSNAIFFIQDKPELFRVCLMCAIQVQRQKKHDTELEMHEKFLFSQSAFQSRKSVQPRYRHRGESNFGDRSFAWMERRHRDAMSPSEQKSHRYREANRNPRFRPRSHFSRSH